jgi:hypothetical protein
MPADHVPIDGIAEVLLTRAQDGRHRKGFSGWGVV